PIKDFLVMVKCTSPVNSHLYSNVHAVISPNLVSSKRFQEEPPLSVLLVGIDSMSKMNLVRTMPKTFQFLEQDFVNLKGYTKIADNTFPNLMAILTGRTSSQIYEYCNPTRNNLNECGFIWDEFSDLGYITAYAEDESSYSSFHYDPFKGFKDNPV